MYCALVRSWVVLKGIDDIPRYVPFFRGASGYEPELTCGGSTDGNLCGKKIRRSAQNQPQLKLQRTTQVSYSYNQVLSVVYAIETIRRYQGGWLPDKPRALRTRRTQKN